MLPLFTITEQSGALLSSTPHSSLSPNRFTSTLKLRLQTTEREVKVGAEEQSPEQQRRTEASNLYSLFTGRTPILPWPTKELVGVGNLHGESDRLQGAFRGLDEWLTGRGENRPVLGDSREGTASSIGSLGFISGFSLQIRRVYDSTSLPGSFPSSTPSSPDLQALADEAPRRPRAVGANGGPAVLWNGGEMDPEAGGGVAVLRANADAGGPGVSCSLSAIWCSKADPYHLHRRASSFASLASLLNESRLQRSSSLAKRSFERIVSFGLTLSSPS